jgi:hypothetical protein
LSNFISFFIILVDVPATLEALYKKFFALGLAGSDLTATKTEFKSLLGKLSINTAQVDNYIAALQSYLAIVVATPTQAQKDAMTAKLDLFDAADKAFVESFFGLNDPNNFVFVANPLNADFNSKRTASSAAKTTLRIFPEQTFIFFTKTATPKSFAEYMFAAITVSARIKWEQTP